MDSELRKLNRKLRQTNWLLLVAFMTIGLLVWMNVSEKNILRTRGIVIEDENGNERILIGAPIPFAQNRVRTDTNIIKATWGQWMGKNYLEWYKDYAHHMNGILIMNEDGWDKIAIGDPAPDPIFGKRIGPSTGMIINDDEGQERSGYGLVDVNGELRMVLGLDNASGTEGATLAVGPDGSSHLSLNTDNQTILVGHAKPGHWLSPDSTGFGGILMKGKNLRIEQ